ncbi:MAG: hypothetical protein PHH06_04135 [Candidatus Gracilibacteria bacterium]|nr:hypothetical protein [Candidatus Gracilibacteria bacterium]
MLLTKAIITTNESQAKFIIQKYNLTQISAQGLEVFEGTRLGDDKEKEKVVLLFSSIGIDNLTKGLDYLFENYDIFKLVNVGTAKAIHTIDAQVGDIYIPNTFLDLQGAEPIFLNYAVGENYDLTKFGLILNGICLTINDFKDRDNLGTDFVADIVDNEAYHILKISKQENKLDKCSVLKVLTDENDNDIAINNSIQILDFVL